MGYVVLAMEGLAATWFILMALHLRDLRQWSLTRPQPRLDAVGRAMQTSAKWAFTIGIAGLYLLSIQQFITQAVLL